MLRREVWPRLQEPEDKTIKEISLKLAMMFSYKQESSSSLFFSIP